MAWIYQHQRILRLGVVIVLAASILGPWVFDPIMVPEKYSCNWPNSYRLDVNFYGQPISGLRMFPWLFAGLFAVPVVILRGEETFLQAAREYTLGLLYLLIFLPILTGLLLAFGKQTRLRMALHWLAWGLAAVEAFPLSMSLRWEMHPALWGIWLFRAGLVLWLGVEILLWRAGKHQTA